MKRLYSTWSILSLLTILWPLNALATKGYETTLHAKGISRTFSETSNKDTPPALPFQPSSDHSSSDKDDPHDDRGGDNAPGTIASLTINEHDPDAETKTIISFSPHGVPFITDIVNDIAMTPAQQLVHNLLNSQNNIQVSIEDDLGHVITPDGQLPLLLTHFMTANDNPVEALNQNPEPLFIPQLLGNTTVNVISALAEPLGGGTLIWIDLTLPDITGPFTIQHFINADHQVQLNLLEGHVNTAVGTNTIATTIFLDDINTLPLSSNQRTIRHYRRDSLTGNYIFMSGDVNSNKNKKGGGPTFFIPKRTATFTRNAEVITTNGLSSLNDRTILIH